MPRKADAAVYLRRLAVARVRNGHRQKAVARFLGVSQRSIHRWVSRQRLEGEAALVNRPHTGRPHKLDQRQTGMVLSWLSRNPCEFGFVNQRWTASRVTELIHRQWGVTMNHRYLSGWLRRRGITPQIPESVAQERDEQEIAWWIRYVWPRIKKKRVNKTQTWFLPMKAAF